MEVLAFSHVYNFYYNGDVQKHIFNDSGYAYIQVYGAQGGRNNHGGKGGYAAGVYKVTPGLEFHVYVGARGDTKGNAFGGGGKAGEKCGNDKYKGGGGGGASDVRVGPFGLEDRIIVAGGGGGSNEQSQPGGDGGGASGERGDGFDSNGRGGSQTEGGSAERGGSVGTFGIGGDAWIGSSSTWTVCSGGGGGGYYGGGGGGGKSGILSAKDSGAGGGGSGFIGKVTSYTNSNLNIKYDAVMLSGQKSNDGFVRINHFKIITLPPTPAATTTPTLSIPLPTASVSPTPSPSVSVSPTPSPGVSVSPTSSPTVSVSPTPSPSVSVSPTPSPSVSVSPTISISPTLPLAILPEFTTPPLSMSPSPSSFQVENDKLDDGDEEVNEPKFSTTSIALLISTQSITIMCLIFGFVYVYFRRQRTSSSSVADEKSSAFAYNDELDFKFDQEVPVCSFYNYTDNFEGDENNIFYFSDEY